MEVRFNSYREEGQSKFRISVVCVCGGSISLSNLDQQNQTCKNQNKEEIGDSLPLRYRKDILKRWECNGHHLGLVWPKLH